LGKIILKTLALLTKTFRRSWRRIAPTNVSGLKNLFLRVFLLPAFFFLLWIFYFDGFSEGADVSRSGFDPLTPIFLSHITAIYYILILLLLINIMKKIPKNHPTPNPKHPSNPNSNSSSPPPEEPLHTNTTNKAKVSNGPIYLTTHNPTSYCLR
jgi:hypothetical protein